MRIILSIAILLLFSSFELMAQSDEEVSEPSIWKEISKAVFENALLDSVNVAVTEERLSALGLNMRTNCKEICESFLVDESSGQDMLLPADFDQGIQGISFSPGGAYFIVYSSYDGPDYDNYYDHRAEMHLYLVGKAYGLDAIIYVKSIYTVEWSIDNLTWVNDSSFAVKTYNESRSFNADEMEFKYFKTELK